MEKRKICFTIPKDMAEEMEKVKKETGVPISKQIELGLKGYSVCKVDKNLKWRKCKDE
jgi:hypothetical protein